FHPAASSSSPKRSESNPCWRRVRRQSWRQGVIQMNAFAGIDRRAAMYALFAVTFVGMLAALLIVAVRIARQDAYDCTTLSNMKFLVGAQQSHHYVHGTLAPTGDKSKSQLSWRVRILPFLGQTEEKLYKQFNLDEPWNSDHNRALISQMPERYHSPGI